MLQGNPDELVQASIESFEIQPDLQTLDRIDQNIQKILAKRSQLLDSYKLSNKELKDVVNRLEIDVQELVNTNNYPQIVEPTQTQTEAQTKVLSDVFEFIEQKLDELKNLRVSISKNLSDLNVLISSNNRSKHKLTENLSELNENYNTLIDKNLLKVKNSNVMKINLYKSLGLVIEGNQQDSDKILIYNEKFGASNFLKVDGQYSEYFISNYIWDKL